jgi:[NiFe] hydrogenase diaphorase moiety small subunit
MVNGRPQAACTQPVAEGMVVENDTPELQGSTAATWSTCCSWRATTSACSARRAATASCRRWPTASASPRRSIPTSSRADVDASHPDMLIDRNRCILCGRCVRASRTRRQERVPVRRPRASTKHRVNAARGPGRHRHRVTDRPSRSARWAPSSRSASACRADRQRLYDHEPIGSDIEPECTGGAAEGAGRTKGIMDGKPKVATARWPAASAATCRCSTSTTASCKLIELVDFDKSPDRRHQGSSRALRRRPDRGRLLQRGERAGAAGLPQALRHPHLGGRLRHHGRHPRHAQHIPLKECLDEAYLNGPTVYNPSGASRTTRSSRCC